MRRSNPIKHAGYKRGCNQGAVERSVAKQNGILTLFKQFRHDLLVMVGCFYFFSDVSSGIFQVFCDAAMFEY